MFDLFTVICWYRFQRGWVFPRSELANYIETVQAETHPRNPKWSKELLNQRKIQQTLAKQKKYQEAAATKKNADVMEEKEYQKYWFFM